VSELTEALDRVPPDSLRPVRLRRNLSLEDVTRVEERRLELPGVIVEIEPARVYPTNTFAAHLLGYVREVSDEQLRQGRYRRGDLIGQAGLERLLDEHLRGQDGGESFEVDSVGRPVRLLERREPRPGAQVFTTVDRRIQEVAEQAMAGHAGAVVVLDPRDGDVLALVSTPAYPLDQLTGNLNREAWLRLIRDPHAPLLNRALQSQYAPGSVFKVVVTAAGLQEGVLTPADRTYCNGQFQLGKWTFHDWKEGGHGHVDLRSSLVHSCNIFFYQAGLRVGPALMARYARAFGLGAVAGVDLGGEKPGSVPWAEGPRGRRAWQAGETVNMAIGQGRLLVTPLQVARMMAAVATGGVLWKPRLVQRVERADGTLAHAGLARATGRVDLSGVVWGFLQSALAGAVSEGTGTAARLPGVAVAGKTGTAQSAVRDAKVPDHAWFASYAPADDPQAVVVVLVERGGKGGQVAAPIARKIYQAIFLERVAMVGLGEPS
jgi:penicillin-binding protein 2